jgi:hypothetical protein
MSERRFTDKPDLAPWAVRGLDASHPAMVEGRTLFPSTVVEVTEDAPDRLLVSGRNNRKLGATVEKGRFKGYALYGLSLEERATCPVDCTVRDICYGNGMQMARRHRIGNPDVFYDRLGFEICDLLDEHDGLLIRLHVLGDFPSVEYVAFWFDVLAEHEKVAIYGYTARQTTAWGGDEIGDAIEALKDQYPERFRIRWSSPTARPDGALVIGNVPKTPRTPDGIVCPAQTDATACCATCGLCWDAPKDAILFVKHGPKSDGAAAETAMEASREVVAPQERSEDNAPTKIAEAETGDLRRVEPLNLLPAPKPLQNIAPTPEPRLVAPVDLRIEATYQRDLSSRSISLIRKIVNGWDWAKFKPPICAEGEDGLCVIDGQHTAIAAATRGIAKIPVLVVTAKLIEKRAEAFVSHNRDRLNVSPFQLLYAEAAAGDTTAQKVLELGRLTGAVIPRSAPSASNVKPGTILSITDLRQAVGAGDVATVERILRIAVMIEAKPLSRMLFRALRMLLSTDHFAWVARLKDSAIANAIADPDILNEMARDRAAQTGESNVRARASIIAEACAEMTGRAA